MLKKVFLVGAIISILLCIGIVSVGAEQIDYCELYGVGCPTEEDPEYQVEPISFSNYIDFKNASADGDEIEFRIRGKQWYNNKNMVITLVLTPIDKSNLTITQEMKKELVSVTNKGNTDVMIKSEHIASTIIKTPKNNTTNPIYYKVEVKSDSQVVATSTNLFVIAGKESIQEPIKTERVYNWSNSGINVAVNDINIQFPDQKPLLETSTSRTYVPVRFLAENLGAEVDWDNEHQVVIIKNKGIEGENTNQLHYLKIGENKFITIRDVSENKLYNKNFKYHAFIFEFSEDIAPVLVNGRTMLPFRYVAELLGSPVYYNEKTNTAHCSKKDLTSLNGDVHIFSTILGEYYADEVNSYRKDWYSGTLLEKNKAHFNGTLSDVAVWACFDKFEHPETGWKTDIEAHTFSISLPNEKGIGALAPYRREFNNFNTLFDNYGESSTQYENVYDYGQITTEIKRKETFNNLNLSYGWGFSSINYSNTEINLYNEKAYRDLSKEIINTFHISPGHRANILYGSEIGVGLFNQHEIVNSANVIK